MGNNQVGPVSNRLLTEAARMDGSPQQSPNRSSPRIETRGVLPHPHPNLG